MAANADHPGNRIHPAYLADRERRALSMAYAKGAEVFKADGAKEKRWVFPAPNEYASAAEAGYLKGHARFDFRLKNWTTSNVFADSLKTSAALPFEHKLTPTGWPKTIEERIEGAAGGLTGRGIKLRDIHFQILTRKLFCGVHFAAAAAVDGRATWRHVGANEVLFWDVRDDPDFGVIVAELVLEGASPSGFITRTVYRLEDGAVTFEEFTSKKKAGADPMRNIYPPRSERDLVLELPAKPSNAGRYVGMSSVPIVDYATSWEESFRAPAPFADAAEEQLKADRAESHVDDYSTRASASPVLFVSGLGLDENGVPNKLISRGALAMTAQPDAKGDWRAIDTEHVPQQLARIEKVEERIRRKCMDPLMESYQGDVKALQVAVGDRRSMSWLELAMRADLGASTRLLRLTCELEGLGSAPDGSLEVSKAKTAAERQAITDRALSWYEAGAITRKTFLLIAKENEQGIGPDLWTEIEKLEAAADEPPAKPPAPLPAGAPT